MPIVVGNERQTLCSEIVRFLNDSLCVVCAHFGSFFCSPDELDVVILCDNNESYDSHFNDHRMMSQVIMMISSRSFSKSSKWSCNTCHDHINASLCSYANHVTFIRNSWYGFVMFHKEPQNDSWCFSFMCVQWSANEPRFSHVWYHFHGFIMFANCSFMNGIFHKDS